MHSITAATDPPHPEVRPVPPRYWWLKRVLSVSSCFVVGLAALWGWWAHKAANELAALIASYQAAGEPIYPEDFNPAPVPDEDNAAVALKRAAAVIAYPTGLRINHDYRYSFAVDPKLLAEWAEDVRLIVEANRGALALLREARHRTGVDWGVEWRSPMIKVVLPQLRDYRELSKLACLAAAFGHHAGDDKECVGTIHDTLALGEAVARHDVLISHLVRVAVSALTCETIESVCPHLRIEPNSLGGGHPASRQAVAALITDLLDEAGFRGGWRHAIFTERAFKLDTMHFLVRGTSYRLLTGVIPPESAKTPFLQRLLTPLLTPMLELDAARIMRGDTGAAGAAKEVDYWRAQRLLPAPPVFRGDFDYFVKVLSDSLSGFYQGALSLHFQTLAMRRMAAIALAIRLYELDHGNRPRRLAELVPAYLEAVLPDPFAPDGRAIGYLPAAAPPILYSVGSNGLDDGGSYALNADGSLVREPADIPFFLDGDRPRAPLPPSATPASQQAEQDDGQEEDGERQSEQDEPANDQP